MAGGLTVVRERPSRTGTSRPARVVLPESAEQPFRLEDEGSGLSIDVTLEGASSARAEVVDGYVVYPDAHEDGADVVFRFSEGGTEDYVRFERAPASPEVRYGLSLGKHVAGLRLVGNVIEVLDASGAPRLRMAPPYVVDAEGKVLPATVSIEGCAVDSLPEAPWGRSVTSPGARRCGVLVAWDERLVKYPAVLDPAWATPGSLAVGRNSANSVVLPNGKVLVVGGHASTGYTPTCELYDPATGTWATTGSASKGRRFNSLSLLSTGKVLSAGGNTSGGLAADTSTELYDPVWGTWSAGAPMGTGRNQHTASILPNGHVLVAGGDNHGSLATAEIYDPVTNSWMGTSSMAKARGNHHAHVLANGKVLVAGGSGAVPWNGAELYDPATSSWSSAGNSSAIHVDAGSVLLDDGRVLLVGGETRTADVYDPVSNTWRTTGSLAVGRRYVTATRLPGGKVLVVGGATHIAYAATAELYDPATGTWSSSATLNVHRGSHVTTLLGNGRVLVAGGSEASPGAFSLASSELYIEDINDLEAPSTALTTPVAGSTLHGTVTLTAIASDSLGVARVEFYSGTTLLGTDITPPYSLAWNTRTAANGPHTLTSKAFDFAGNSGASTTVSVTLDNDLDARWHER